MSILKKFPVKTAALAAAILALPGCFDEDEGGGPSLPADAITLTDLNAQTTAEAVMTNDAISDSLGNVGLRNSNQGTSSHPLRELAVDTALQINQVTGDSLERQVVSGSVNCAQLAGGTSGSVSMNGTIDDLTGAANLTINFNECVINGDTMDGRIAVNESISGSVMSGTVTANLSFTASGGDSFTLSGFRLEASEDESTGVWTVSINYALSSTAINGGILVETNTTITGDDLDSLNPALVNFNPDAGQVTIMGANDTAIRVTAVSDQEYQLELDANGDGVFENLGTFPWPAGTF